MNKKNSLNFSLLLILSIGFFGAGSLVLEELKTGDACPKIINIPMCIVILVCFAVPLISHLFKKWHRLYFIFSGFAFLIALLATTMQLFGHAECPKTETGIPMCYFSLLLSSLIIVIKRYLLKSNSL